MGLTDFFSDLVSGFGLAEAHAEAPPAEQNDDSVAEEQEEKTEESAEPAEESTEESDEAEPEAEAEEAEEGEEEEEEEEEPEDIKPKLEEGEYTQLSYRVSIFKTAVICECASLHIHDSMRSCKTRLHSIRQRCCMDSQLMTITK